MIIIKALKNIIIAVIVIALLIDALPIIFSLIGMIFEIAIVLGIGFLAISFIIGIFSGDDKNNKTKSDDLEESCVNVEYSDVNESKNEYMESECFDTKIVGVSFENRQELIKRLLIDENVFIVRDVNNKFDSNAIAVLNKKQELLGYISKDIAKKIAFGIDNKSFKYYGKVAAIRSKDNNYGVTITVNRKKYNTDLECIKWEKELINEVKDIYDLGIQNTDIREKFEYSLPGLKYYRSIYVCPCCNTNLLYKIKSRGVSTSYNEKIIKVFNIFTCTRCRRFFVSVHSKVYGKFFENDTSSKLSNYAIQSEEMSNNVYNILLNHTNSLYNENENGNYEFNNITIRV